MWVLDILNLNRRKLNHHEQVYSQESIPEAAYLEQELGDAGNAAAFASQPKLCDCAEGRKGPWRQAARRGRLGCRPFNRMKPNPLLLRTGRQRRASATIIAARRRTTRWAAQIERAASRS